MDKPQLWTKNFIGISIANFLAFTSFYYLLVILPIYSLQELHGSESGAGLITTVFLISAILIRPFAGVWIGKVGKKLIFLTALLILSGASALYMIPESITALLVLRFLHGIGFGMATTATGAIVADLIPDSRKGEGMGYYGLTMNLAMVVGPFLGLTMMQQGGTNITFLVNAACSILALIAGLLVQIPHRATERQAGRGVSAPAAASFFEPSAVPISVVSAFFALVYAAIISFVSVYANEMGIAQAASYFFVVYAVVLLVSRPFTGKWFDRYGANVIIYPAVICFAVGTFLLSVSSSTVLFLLSAALIGLGWGTVFPSLQTIAIQLAAPHKRALATATFLSIFDFGFGVGSFLFGLAAVHVGHASLYLYSTFLVIIGIGIYYVLHGRVSQISKMNGG